MLPIATASTTSSGSALRKRLAQLLALLTVIVTVLLVQEFSQTAYEAQFARDINNSTSFRYRSLLIYNLTRMPRQDAARYDDWRVLLRDMQRSHAELQPRHPEEIAVFDTNWNRYQQELSTRGTVELATATATISSTNQLIVSIEKKEQQRALYTRFWLAAGTFIISLALPWGFLLFGQLRDTQRKLSQQNVALEASAGRFRSLFDGVPVPCFSYDLEGRITAWNHAAETVFGYASRDVEGLLFWEVTSSPERWPIARQLVGRVTSGEALAELEWKHPHHDGTTRHFISSVFPLRDSHGTIIGGLAANVDLTSRVEALSQLQATTGELTRSNAALQDFAYVASHDLKEPLRKIQMFGGMLRRRMKDAPTEQVEHLDRVLNAASRMQTLIEGLMEYSRVTTRGRDPEVVALTPLIRDVLQDLEARVNDTNARVEIASLPEVCADALQMRQLFQNLLSNALKFHDRSRPAEVHVWAEADDAAQRVQVFVRDNGIGFEPKFADRIFDVFERLESKRDFEGTGIGLAICRKIVERHGGAITAAGLPGQGATFTLDLPLAPNKECA